MNKFKYKKFQKLYCLIPINKVCSMFECLVLFPYYSEKNKIMYKVQITKILRDSEDKRFTNCFDFGINIDVEERYLYLLEEEQFVQIKLF